MIFLFLVHRRRQMVSIMRGRKSWCLSPLWGKKVRWCLESQGKYICNWTITIYYRKKEWIIISQKFTKPFSRTNTLAFRDLYLTISQYTQRVIKKPRRHLIDKGHYVPCANKSLWCHEWMAAVAGKWRAVACWNLAVGDKNRNCWQGKLFPCKIGF